MRDQAFRKIQVLPLKYIDSHPYGEVVSRVIADVRSVCRRPADGLFPAVHRRAHHSGHAGFHVLPINVRHHLCGCAASRRFPCSWRTSSRWRTFTMFKLQSEVRVPSRPRFVDEMIGNQKVVQAFGRTRPPAQETLTRSTTACSAMLPQGNLLLLHHQPRPRASSTTWSTPASA